MEQSKHRLKVKPVGKPAAKQGDKIVGTDIHILMIPAAAGVPVPTPTPMPFNGMITSGLSTDVFIEGKPAATVQSGAVNMPPHIPAGGPFQKPPTNQGKIMIGSTGVFINGKPAARQGDTAITCNDPVDAPTGTVMAVGTVFIGETGAGAPAPPSQAATQQKQVSEGEQTDNDLEGESAQATPQEPKLLTAKWGQLGKIVSVNWEKDRAKSGEEVKMITNVEDFDDGTPAKFLVWQRKDGEDIFVAEIDGKVQGNKIEATWKHSPKEQKEEEENE